MMGIMSDHTNTNIPTLIDRKQLASRWCCSIPTIQRREKDGTLNPIYIPGGRLVRYRLEDIEQIEQESIRKEAV